MMRIALLGLFLLVSATAQAVDITANQKGRVTSAGNASIRTFHQYDPQGRELATQYAQDGQSRTFTTTYGYPQNPNPQPTPGPGTVIVSERFPDGDQVTYTYDLNGTPVTVRSTLGASTDQIVRDVQMNARGQITRKEFGNGVVTTYTYDETGTLRLTRATSVTAAGQTVQDYSYSYDKNGNVTGVSDGVRADQSATYDYDSLDQLTNFLNFAGSVIERYDYDPIGNLTQKGALLQSYGAGGRPHALAASGGTSYGYDPNGNVTTIGSSTTITWNSENMPAKVTTGSAVTDKSFVGEALWKKVEPGMTTYYLPSMRVENGVARKYYGGFAERLEQAGDRQLRFYQPDHLGSSSVMTDQAAGVIRRASYLPWGQDRGVDATFTPKLQFNFKEKDTSDFYDYGARLYSPLTGRWLSPDSSFADGLNVYTYVGNNPASRTDPTGHQQDDPPCGWGVNENCRIDGDVIKTRTNQDKTVPADDQTLIEEVRRNEYMRRENWETYAIFSGGRRSGTVAIHRNSGNPSKIPRSYETTLYVIQSNREVFPNRIIQGNDAVYQFGAREVIEVYEVGRKWATNAPGELLNLVTKQSTAGLAQEGSGQSEPNPTIGPEKAYTYRRLDTLDPRPAYGQHDGTPGAHQGEGVPMPTGETLGDTPHPWVKVTCWLVGCNRLYP
jgi:RHS repeat-associated protein